MSATLRSIPFFIPHSTLNTPHFKNGASGRPRTDEYEFTKLALWLLRHRGLEDLRFVIFDLRAADSRSDHGIA
jgi:hypothetical protein